MYGDQIYHADVVPADHDKYGVIGRYHKCDHSYYVPMVPADHCKYGVTGVITHIMYSQYHRCDH
jgi:hypothetical protein